LGADHLIVNWGFDENLPKLAGKAADGAIAARRGLFTARMFR
jgi:branched-chain amino acid transport system substrate-binding protein